MENYNYRVTFEHVYDVSITPEQRNEILEKYRKECGSEYMSEIDIIAMATGNLEITGEHIYSEVFAEDTN